MAGERMDAPLPSHRPVMYAQVLDGLNVRANGVYLDGTFGRGGHARGVLEKLNRDGKLLVMDKDPEAIALATQWQAADARVAVFHGSFAAMAQWNATQSGLDGILLDLGVSSPQLDVAERGFSFRFDGPLDMRMNSSAGETAAQWLARAEEKEIADVLWMYGEERQSRRIARTIVNTRATVAIDRTAQLADLIAGTIGRGDGHIHPATRSFQAIRIFINRELDDLQTGLDAAHALLKPGGRLAVISFHSLEDRMVKQFIAKHAKAPAGNRRMPVQQAFIPTLKDISGALRADDNEVQENPRARSAVLRIAEKCEVSA